MRAPGILSASKLWAGVFLIGLMIVAVKITGVRARPGDTVADRVLGQPDLFHNSPNALDANSFNQPNQLVIDKSANPNRLYVADWQNNRVLAFHSVAALVTGGPADLVVGQSDFYSAVCNNAATDDAVTQSTLCIPAGVAVDSAGNLFVADSGNNRVLEFNNPFATMKATGMTAGFAASLVLGQSDFSSRRCNTVFGGTPNAVNLCTPVAVALDSHHNLFVADADNQRVLEYNAGFRTGAKANKVFGQLGSFTTSVANKGGVSARSLDLSPQAHSALAVDPNSNSLYVADYVNNRVLKFNSPLTSDTANAVFGQLGSFTQNICDINGGPNATSLCGPYGVTVDKAGDVFIADTAENRVLGYKPPILKNPAANVVFGGSCSPVSAGTMCSPAGVGVDSSGNLYVDDLGNNRLLIFFPPFPAYPFADQVLGQPDTIHNDPNSVDPEGMHTPAGIAIDRNTAPNHLYVADFNNSRILAWRDATKFVNNQPADLVIGQPDFYSSFCNQTVGPSERTLCNPDGLAVDKSGNLFVADLNNSRVLEYRAPFSTGYITGQPASAVFGQAGSFNSNFCNQRLAISAKTLCTPTGVAIDPKGKLYVVDNGNNRVLEYDPPFAVDAAAAHVVGQANFTAALCNRSASPAPPDKNTLCLPDEVATDAVGNLYIADTLNNRVLEYNAPITSGASAVLVFGQDGSFTANGCNDVGLNEDSLCTPQGVGVDAAGNLYIADGTDGSVEPNLNNRVLEYNTPLHRTATPGSGDTTADRVFGQGNDFTSGNCNFAGPSPSPNSLCNPMMATFDSTGNLYITDSFNNRVVEYDVPVPLPTPTPHAPAPTPTPPHR